MKLNKTKYYFNWTNKPTNWKVIDGKRKIYSQNVAVYNKIYDKIKDINIEYHVIVENKTERVIDIDSLEQYLKKRFDIDFIINTSNFLRDGGLFPSLDYLMTDEINKFNAVLKNEKRIKKIKKLFKK